MIDIIVRKDTKIAESFLKANAHTYKYVDSALVVTIDEEDLEDSMDQLDQLNIRCGTLKKDGPIQTGTYYGKGRENRPITVEITYFNGNADIQTDNNNDHFRGRALSFFGKIPY